MKKTLISKLLNVTLICVVVGTGFGMFSREVSATSYPSTTWAAADNTNYTLSNRENTHDITYIVIHVAQGGYQGTISHFQDPNSDVSAHYVVSKTGDITAMVRDEDIAWHAGNGNYNSHSIGIEHEGFVNDPSSFTEAMYQASADLVKWLAQRYNIQIVHPSGIAPASATTASGIIGHNQVPDPYDPSQGGGINHRTDPGSHWDWAHYMDLVAGGESPKKSVGQIIMEVTIGEPVIVSVGGNKYKIVTLNSYINPNTLELESPSYQPIKVYVNSSGNPVTDESVLRKIALIDRARQIQEKGIMVSIVQEQLDSMDTVLNSRWLQLKRYTQIVSDVVSNTVARTLQAVMSQQAAPEDWDDLVTRGLVTSPILVINDENREPFSQIFYDPTIAVESSLYIDSIEATYNFEAFRLIDQSSDIIEYETAEDYLSYLYTGCAYSGLQWWNAISEIRELNKGMWSDIWDMIKTAGEGFLSAITDGLYGVAKGLLQAVLDDTNEIPWLNDYFKGRVEALAGVHEKVHLAELNIHARYTLDLANQATEDILFPDLTLSPAHVEVTPLLVEAGNKISVTFTVKNIGGAPSGPFTNRVSLATPPNKWGTDILLGNFDMESLDAGYSRPSTVVVCIPQDITVGNYYVTVYTDAFRVVEESEDIGSSNPNNIGSTEPVILSVTQSPSIDLMVSAINAPASAEVGKTIPISFLVKNLGNSPSGSFTNRIFLATRPWGTDITLADFYMSPLGSKVVRKSAVEVTIPSSLPAEKYYFTVYADGFKEIAETDENNNIGTQPMALNVDFVPPSVFIGNPTGGERLSGGQDYIIRWSTRDDVAVLLVDIYYTTNGWQNSEKLAAVQPDINSYVWTIPLVDTSQAAIKVIASDAAGNVGFALSNLFRIDSTSLYPDLYVSNINVSDSTPDIGQQITITTTVTNQGNTSSGATKLKYYFSTSSSGKDNYLGESSIEALSMDSSTTVTKVVTIPDITAGEAYIVAVVNSDNMIAEALTTNNVNRIPVTVRLQDNEEPTITYLKIHWGGGANNNIFQTGHEYTIVFTVDDNVAIDSLDFYYSANDGITWDPIITNFVIGSNGLGNGYRWMILPDTPLTTTGKVKMVARDTSGHETTEFTDTFTIIDGTPPDITVLSPNGGEVWNLGSQHEITWIASSSIGIESVEILFYYADTAEYLTLETESDGAYTWTLPTSSSFITKTGKIKIETIDANGNRAEDWSDGYFTIRDPSLPPPPPWTVPERLTIVPPDDIPVKNHETPVLAVDNDGIVHLVYKYTQDDLGIEANKRVITQQILYKKLVGSSWSNAETVYTLIQEIDVGGDWHNIRDLQLAVDSSNSPHIVWLQGPGGIGAITNINLDEVYYACRNTSEWSLPLNISNNSNVSREPRITIEPSDNIHIVWIDGYTKNPEQGISGQPNIYYKKKDNITGSWSVTSQITEGGALSPSIAADGTGNLHLVFTSYDSENIYYKKWDGSSWLNTTTVAVGGCYESLNIVSDTSSHLHMVCYDYSKDEEDNYQQRILYSYYDGNAWSVPEEVSDRIPGSNPNYPSIVTDSSDRPHVIWEDHSNSSIFYKRKHIFGLSNRVKLNLDSQHPEENSSCMTISDNDHAYVAWTNYYNGHSEVFYNHADDLTPLLVASLSRVRPLFQHTPSEYFLSTSCVA